MKYRKAKKAIAETIVAKGSLSLIKKLLLFLISSAGAFFAFGIFILLCVCYVLIAKEGAESQGIVSFVSFSPEVEAYRYYVAEKCEENDITEFTNCILAIMQVETGGTTLDPMNAGDKEFNTLYPKKRGLIEDPEYSIDVGVLEFKAILGELGIRDLAEIDNLMIAFQAYHFDRGYIDFANSHGGYSTDSAKEYLNQSELPYYLRTTFATNVAAYVFIIGGSIETFVYPVDDINILYSFGDRLPNGSTATGTYFKTDGEVPIYAITDGDVARSITGRRSITIYHNNYTIKYKLLNVHDDCIPEYIPGDEEEEGYWEDVYVEKGEEIGTSLEQSDDYQFFLQILYNGQYIDPMTILDITVSPDYDAESGNDPLRDAVVDYAKLWMSTPYVWGGTNLHTGVDCSGFMQQIYKNFGFSIPRTSREQANYKGAVWSTTEVIPDLLLKGDLIFYVDNKGVVNHVVMYIGNGMIIGAQSAKSGIRIVQYNYRTPVKAIRIIP